MDPHDIDRLRRRLATLGAHADALGRAFYAELFALAPALRARFDADLETQVRKLVDMLSVAVEALDDPSALAPVLAELGRRHLDYGVVEDDYDLAGVALMRALRRCVDDIDTGEEEAWGSFYGELAEAMIAGARGP